VNRANGNRWTSKSVTVEDTDVTLSVSAPAQRVAGSVKLGDRPLAASLSFGGEGGTPLQSDEAGRFEGEIPRGESEREIFIEAHAQHVRRTISAKFEERDSGDWYADIELPASALIGRVVREDGAPEPHALLTATGQGHHAFYQAFANEDGTFQISGPDAGEYAISAESEGKRSEQVTVRVTENAAGEVQQLVIRPQVVVRGRLGMGAVPLVGAEIRAIPRDTQWIPFMPHTTSNERGRFELQLPPRTTTFDFVAVHPAFDVTLGRRSVQTGTTLHVVANQIGGTLVIDSDAPKDLLLRHDGGEYWASWLARLAGGSVDAARVVLPRLEPGQYSACSSKTNKCVSGELSPYGTLKLALD
jgi:hypothetical protein